MFELGQYYVVSMWEPEPETDGGAITEFQGCQVVEVALPLVTFLYGRKEIIVNTASQSFVMAIPQSA